MSEKRKSLKRLVGMGSAVALTPRSWFKPVVNVVVLPAHAQTSTVLPAGTFVNGWACLEFVHEDGHVRISAKIIGVGQIYKQGTAYIPGDTYGGRPQIVLDENCAGEKISPIDSLVIESYTETEVVYGYWIEKYLSGYVVSRGDCTISCTPE